MTPSQILLLLLLTTLVILLIKFQQHTTAIFGGMLMVIFAMGWVNSSEILGNAANEGLATLVLLILISFVLEKTSILNQLTRILFAKSERSSIIRTIGFSGIASALLNNTAVVAAMISSIQSSDKVSSSRILLPMCFAATLGGTMTLIGTSTNLVINSMWVKQGHEAIGFFDLFPVGIVIFLVGSVVLFFTSMFLPKVEIEKTNIDEYFVEAKVDENSPLVGKTIGTAGLRNLSDLFLVEIIRGERLIAPVSHHHIIEADDKLMFSGDIAKIQILEQFDGLRSFAHDSGLPMQTLTEVAIKQDSSLVGRTLKSTGFRAKFDAAVVAVRRESDYYNSGFNGNSKGNANGRRNKGNKGNRGISGKLGEVTLKAGDLLLLATGEDFVSRHNIRKNFYVLSGVTPENMITGWQEKLVILGFITMIAGSVITGASLFSTSIFLFAILLFTDCINIDEIKRHFPISIWLIVVSALCLANAMQAVGLDQVISQTSAQSLAGLDPIWMLVGVMIATITITELLTNNAAAALMFPIAYSLAIGMDINPYPMVLAVCLGASCAFMSPFGYQTNLMVYNTGVYKLQDFAKVGGLITLTFIIICAIILPIVYPF